MKRYLALTGTAIVIAAFAIPLPETRSLQAAAPKSIALPDFAMQGTWVFAESESDAGIPIENPKIVYIEGVPFVVGKRKGRFETFQETMFAGGVTYIRLKSVNLIQQVPESN
ncbi:hypothetical protein SH528x_001036 [Novipirellula sp. SH528]|uniref:hypothetical protein n=1 Tax=Novipirellula sp. SH528 TaxID=3454466 RepID=UPI003F9F944E